MITPAKYNEMCAFVELTIYTYSTLNYNKNINKMYISISYFVNVAQTISAGSVAGNDKACNNFAPRCRNIQLASPLFADSI